MKGWNEIAMQAYNDNSELVILGNDDTVCETCSWDIELENVFNNIEEHKIACMLLNGNSSEEFAFSAVTRNWIKYVGSYSPGIFHIFYLDTWIYDISRMANCIIEVKSVYINHKHIRGGKK